MTVNAKEQLKLLQEQTRQLNEKKKMYREQLNASAAERKALKSKLSENRKSIKLFKSRTTKLLQSTVETLNLKSSQATENLIEEIGSSIYDYCESVKKFTADSVKLEKLYELDEELGQEEKAKEIRDLDEAVNSLDDDDL